MKEPALSLFAERFKFCCIQLNLNLWCEWISSSKQYYLIFNMDNGHVLKSNWTWCKVQVGENAKLLVFKLNVESVIDICLWHKPHMLFLPKQIHLSRNQTNTKNSFEQVGDKYGTGRTCCWIPNKSSLQTSAAQQTLHLLHNLCKKCTKCSSNFFCAKSKEEAKKCVYKPLNT